MTEKAINSRRWLNIIPWFLLGCVLTVLIIQTYNPAWRGHMQVDVATFYNRANFFLNHQSWLGLEGNEYQPGALWFFALLGFLTPPPITFDAFLAVTVIANVLLAVAHFDFFRRYGHSWSVFFFVILLLATGSILFFRFELLVSLLILYAWHYLKKQQYLVSAILLGFATAIKVYPVIFLPLLFLDVIRQRRILLFLQTSLLYIIGLSIPVLLLMGYGATVADLTSGFNFHQLKPVGLEGIWGSAITAWHQYTEVPLLLTPGYGVFGFTSEIPFLTNNFLNSFWMVPYFFTLGLIAYFWRREGYSDPGLAWLLIFVFVFFAKVLNPQYLWWFVSFMPLIPLVWYDRHEWVLIIFTTVMSLIVTQLVYPLHYTEFLDWFRGVQGDPTIFYYSVLRNLFLTVLAFLAVTGVKKAYTHLPERI